MMEDSPPQSSVSKCVRLFEIGERKSPVVRKPLYHSDRMASQQDIKTRALTSGKGLKSSLLLGRLSSDRDLGKQKSHAKTDLPDFESRMKSATSGRQDCSMQGTISTAHDHKAPMLSKFSSNDDPKCYSSSLSQKMGHQNLEEKPLLIQNKQDAQTKQALRIAPGKCRVHERQQKQSTTDIRSYAQNGLTHSISYQKMLKAEDSSDLQSSFPKLQLHRWEQRCDNEESFGRFNSKQQNRDEAEKEESSKKSLSSVYKSYPENASALYRNTAKTKSPASEWDGGTAVSAERKSVNRTWAKDIFEAKIHSCKVNVIDSQEVQRQGSAIHLPFRCPIQQSGKHSFSKTVNQASAIVNETKANSIGGSSSSEESSFSQQKSCKVASQDMELSKAHKDDHFCSRQKKSPLGQMMAEKRSVKIYTKPKPGDQKKNDLSAYGSTQRLSDRLTRAQRFTALKKHQIHQIQVKTSIDESSLASSSLSPVKTAHPVFGYSQHDTECHSVAVDSIDASDVSSRLYQNKCHQENISIHSTFHHQLLPERKFRPNIDRRPLYKEAVRQNKALRSNQKNASPTSQDLSLRRQASGTPSQSSKLSKINMKSFQYTKLVHSANEKPLQSSQSPIQAILPNGRLAQQTLDFLAYDRKLCNELNAEQPEEHFYVQCSEESSNYVHARQGQTRCDGSYDDFKDERRPAELSIHAPVSTETDDLDQLSVTESTIQPVKQQDSRTIFRKYNTTPVESNHTMLNSLQRVVDSKQQSNAPLLNQINQRQLQRNKSPTAFEKARALTIASKKRQPKQLQTLSSAKHMPLRIQVSLDNHGTCKPNEKSIDIPSPTNKDPQEVPQVASQETSTSTQDPLQWFHHKYGPVSPITKPSPANATLRILSPSKAATGERSQCDFIEDETDDIFDGLEESTIGSREDVIDKPPSRDEISFKPKRKCHSPERQRSPEQLPSTKDRTPLRIIATQIAVKGETSNIHPTHRRNPDDAIKVPLKKVETASDIEDEASILDDESLIEGRKANTAMFVDLGIAFVNSIKNSCAIPAEKIPEVALCAMEAKTKCMERINSACTKGKESSVIEDYKQIIPVRNNLDCEDHTGLGKLNLIERHIRDAWKIGSQDETSDKETSNHYPVSSDSSNSHNTKKEEQNPGLREDAQKQLSKHVENALDLINGNVGQISSELHRSNTSAIASQHAGTHVMKREATCSPGNSKLSGKKFFEQRSVLEAFSTQLKTEGVEVIKLGRRNKWQLRYLTVSQEVIDLGSSNEIDQCPKALLWLKQNSPQNFRVTTIKDNGRGGVLFEYLQMARMVESNEFYNNLPKKLKELFPIFAGIVLDYTYEGGERQLHFCFKTKIEAQAFCTAVMIIKEATTRSQSRNKDRNKQN